MNKGYILRFLTPLLSASIAGSQQYGNDEDCGVEHLRSYDDDMGRDCPWKNSRAAAI